MCNSGTQRVPMIYLVEHLQMMGKKSVERQYPEIQLSQPADCESLNNRKYFQLSQMGVTDYRKRGKSQGYGYTMSDHRKQRE